MCSLPCTLLMHDFVPSLPPTALSDSAIAKSANSNGNSGSTGTSTTSQLAVGPAARQ
jgi:hypothetical protein